MDAEDPATHVVQPGLWRDGIVLDDIHNVGGNTVTRDSKEQRIYLAEYYNSPVGAVPWLDKIVI